MPLDIYRILEDEASGNLDPRFTDKVAQLRTSGQLPPPKPTLPGKPAPFSSQAPTPPPLPKDDVLGDWPMDDAQRSKMLHMAPLLAPGIGSAAAIGAGISGYEDRGILKSDPIKAITHAGIHAGGAAAPFAAGKIMAGGVPAVADVMSKAGGVKGVLGSALKWFSKSAPEIAAAPEDELIGAELANGQKLLSPEGIKAAKQHVTELANQGKAFGDTQFDAADALWRRATDYVERNGFTPSSLAKSAGLQMTTTAERAAERAKQMIDMAKERVSHYTNLSKIISGLGTSAYDAMSTPHSEAKLPTPPTKKP